MKIGNFDTDERVLLLAEIGNNHEGDFGVAKELTQAAAALDVSAVKFQTFRTEYYVSKSDEKRFARLKSFELTLEQFRELRELAHSLGLLFISTPLDLESASGLEGIVDAYKIASGDNTFYPLISQVARTGKPTIISTGISDGQQVKHIVDFVQRQWDKAGIAYGQLGLLHCVKPAIDPLFSEELSWGDGGIFGSHTGYNSSPGGGGLGCPDCGEAFYVR